MIWQNYLIEIGYNMYTLYVNTFYIYIIYKHIIFLHSKTVHLLALLHLASVKHLFQLLIIKNSYFDISLMQIFTKENKFYKKRKKHICIFKHIISYPDLQSAAKLFVGLSVKKRIPNAVLRNKFLSSSLSFELFITSMK